VADRIRLRVSTPEQEVLDRDVGWVTAPATLGEIQVLPGHAALVTSLDAGTLSWDEGGGRGRLAIGGGFAEVRDDVVTVLADSAHAVTG
jgi:F-type H+-transporting ATPase subunit epsilon